MCMHALTYHNVHVEVGRQLSGVGFSASAMWVPGIEPQLSKLGDKYLCLLNLLTAPKARSIY